MPSKGNNSVEQKVTLNNKEYLKSLKGMSRLAAQTSVMINKGFESMKVGAKSLTESVKKDGLSLKKSFDSLMGNLGRGGAAIGLATGFQGLSASVKDAARSSADFDRTFSRLAQRFDFSKDKVKQLRNEYRRLAGETGVNGGQITGAASNLLAATNGKSTAGLKDIAQFSKLSDDIDASTASRDIVDFLKGNGREVSGSNIRELLESSLALQRNGDFSLKEALAITTKSDGNALARAGLSTRENAALLAGASGVGQDRASTSAAIQAIIKKSVEGFGKGSALQGILGVEGGSLLTNGKFDISKLGQASKNLKARGMSSQDSVALLQSAGLSEGEAEGLYSILNDFDTFQKGFKKTIGDQKTLESAFKESTRNLPDALEKIRERIISGVDEITNPLTLVGLKLVEGDLKGAAGAAPGAIGDSLKGVMDNKLLAGTMLGGTILTGGLLSKIGLFGGAKGIAKGVAVEEATGDRVQAVYVTNIDEISSGLGNIPGIGGGGALGKLKGLAGKAAPLLGKAGGVAAAGYLGYEAGSWLNDNVVSKTNMKTSEGFEGNIIETLFFKLDKLIGGESAQKIQDANKILLEIDSVDNGFKVRPKRQGAAIEIKDR